MERLTMDVVVRAPADLVYRQWSRFEELPQIISGLQEVRRLDDRRHLWSARVLGKEARWESEIEEQRPNRSLAWKSVGGHPVQGRLSFTPMIDDPSRTHIVLVMEYQPLGVVEELADFLGLVSHRLEKALEQFKDYIEAVAAGEQPAANLSRN